VGEKVACLIKPMTEVDEEKRNTKEGSSEGRSEAADPKRPKTMQQASEGKDKICREEMKENKEKIGYMMRIVSNLHQSEKTNKRGRD